MLGVADVDCDGDLEVLVGTMEFGTHPDGLRGIGRLLSFGSREDGSFENTWTSEWTESASIPAIFPFDMNQDGCDDFLYNGEDVYAHSGDGQGFEVIRSFEGHATELAQGHFGGLRVPSDAVRIVPMELNTQRSLRPGMDVEGTIQLKNLWAGANNVRVSLGSSHPAISVLSEEVQVGDMAPGGITDPIPFQFRVNDIPLEPQWSGEDGGFHALSLWLQITADPGHQQTIPIGVEIRTPG